MADKNTDLRRIFLLNRMLSVSKTRTRDHTPPTHGAMELFEVLEGRRRKGFCVEYFGAEDDEVDEKRIEKGNGHSLIRLRHMRFERDDQFEYVTLLVEFIDENTRSFPVVHTKTFTGREIAGDEAERGAKVAHVCVRMPKHGNLDDGNYRCAIEAVHQITRKDIEVLLSKQLRRANDWEFPVTLVGRRASTTKMYKYYPRFQFVADMARSLGAGGSTLTHMLFTKRDELSPTGKPKEILHETVYADIEYKISAKQGPNDPAARRLWFENIRNYFELNGYKTKLYFRHGSGGLFAGEVHHSVEGAADLLMCHKELVTLTTPAKVWQSNINSEIADAMKATLNKEELWAPGE